MKNRLLKLLTSLLILSFVFSAIPQTTHAAVRKTVRDRVAPTAPRIVKSLSVTDTTITISWLASRDAVGVKSYAVYRNGVRVAVTKALTCTVAGLKPLKSYKLTVRAYDAAGNRSKSSNTLTKKTLAKGQEPAAPQIPISAVAVTAPTSAAAPAVTASTAAPAVIVPIATVPAATEKMGQFPILDADAFSQDEYGTKPGITASGDGSVLIDTGTVSEGVVLVNINAAPDGRAWKAVLKGPTGSYAYTLPRRGTFEGLPLQMGSGSYFLTVYEPVSGTSYTTKMTHSFEVTLRSGLSPYTASSVMVHFSAASASTGLARSLVAGKTTQEARIDAIYQWICQNIQYDRELAARITSGAVKTHIPDPDATLASRKGICYDYAALLAAMLRSQGIPTRLVMGQIPQGYHAWNEVYLEGTGWFRLGDANYSAVNGNAWVMLDPTFAASGMSPQTILQMTHNVERIY